MRELILHTIMAITDGKKSRRLEPSAALYSEISTEVHRQVDGEVKETLNALVKDGILTFHRTINSVSFEIKK